MAIRESGTQFVSEALVTASFESDAIDLQQKDFAIQAVWKGTVTGSIKLLASVNGVTYSDIPNTTKTISDGGSEIWNMTSQNYPYLKVSVTISTGTATAIGCWLTSKSDT